MNNTALEVLLGACGPGLEGRKRGAQCTDVFYVFAARSSDKQEDLKLLQLGTLGFA